MPRINLAILICLCALSLKAQELTSALTPMEIKDPAARRLQQAYITQLNQIGDILQKHPFPYNFYLSRTLDLDEKQQLHADQRSIRFEKYNSQIVLAITGNYYAAYSDSLMDTAHRVRKTFQDVVMPILQTAVPPLATTDSFGAFAIEVSHHVRRKVLGVEAENPENITFILPRAAAQHLIAAKDVEHQQAALLDSEVYLDAQPFSLWLTDAAAAAAERNPVKGTRSSRQEAASAAAPPADSTPPEPSVSPKLLGNSTPVRLITPETLRILSRAHADEIGRMTHDLDSQAHFVAYAPPSFIAFRQRAYLQLSTTTSLQGIPAASRYQLAALAFDDHISHLVRPVLAYVPASSDFDGISFSTTIRLNGAGSTSVEFFLPFETLSCFANYDCTGQQLIDAGVVLINGERAGLNLQGAEALAQK